MALQNQQTIVEVDSVKPIVGSSDEYNGSPYVERTSKFSELQEIVVCPDCRGDMEWSDYADSTYAIGWNCNNVLKCEHRTQNCGKWRWFCKTCSNDYCMECADKMKKGKPAQEPQSFKQQTPTTLSLASTQASCPSDTLSDQSRSGSKIGISLPTDEGTLMPPLMDLHRLQTDEDAYFSQSSMPPLMDLHRLQTDEDAYFSQSSMPPMMDLHRLQTDEDAYFPPLMDLHRLQTDEDAYFPQSSMPPVMDLHRLQTDEEAYFRQSSIPPISETDPLQTNKEAGYPQYVAAPACNARSPAPRTVAPTMTSPSPPPPPEDDCMVLALSSLLQSPGGAKKSNAAHTNPSVFPSGHVIQQQQHHHQQMLAAAAAAGLAAAAAAAVASNCSTLHYHEDKFDSSNTAQGFQAKSAKKQKKKLNKGGLVPTEGGPGLVPTEGPTTLMIRGIPCSVSQEDLLELIDNVGLKGKYDFFYLPNDKNNKNKNKCSKNVNLGYAFVNFVDHQSAELCTNSFTGVQLVPSRSVKQCAVSPASIQGLRSLQAHFRGRAVSRETNEANSPMFFKI